MALHERPEGTVTVAGTGIGPALRKARLLRGKSIEEASRETRIRADYLKALERETFDALLGDVYVRGFLRSYSTYLGLEPTRVLSIYNRHFGLPPEPGRNGNGPASSVLSRREDPRAVRIHLSWKFLIGVALLVLMVFAAVGLLARADKPPGAGRIPAVKAAPPSPAPVTVGLKTRADVRVTVWIDGGDPVTLQLPANEVRSFQGEASIRIRLEHGGATTVTVNDHSLGTPGRRSAPYDRTFGTDSFRGEEASPSPGNTSSSARP